jgi:hypothetical protein
MSMMSAHLEQTLVILMMTHWQLVVSLKSREEEVAFLTLMFSGDKLLRMLKSSVGLELWRVAIKRTVWTDAAASKLSFLGIRLFQMDP